MWNSCGLELLFSTSICELTTVIPADEASPVVTVPVQSGYSDESGRCVVRPRRPPQSRSRVGARCRRGQAERLGAPIGSVT
jgi:hypothetical protein